jgi:hypothetical protein
MSTKSRQHLYGTTIRMSAEKAKHARHEADRLACEAWNFRNARLQRTGTAIADNWRRAQCRVWIS